MAATALLHVPSEVLEGNLLCALRAFGGKRGRGLFDCFLAFCQQLQAYGITTIANLPLPFLSLLSSQHRLPVS